MTQPQPQPAPAFSLSVLVLRVLSYLPLPWVLALAAGIGRVMTWLPLAWVGPYRNCVINLMLAYPNASPEAIRELARGAMIETAKTIAEMSHVWVRPTAQTLARIRTVQGDAPLREAIAQQQPVVIVAMHQSNWEVVGLWLGRLCDPVVLYQPGKDAALDQLVLNARSREGSQLFPADRRGIKACMAALQAGGVAAILADHIPAGTGNPMVPFFGVPAATSGLIPKLANKHKARVFFLSNYRDADGGHHVCVDVADSAIGSDVMQHALQVQNEGIAHAVERSPQQYNWPYKRYRISPAGNRRRLYKKSNAATVKKLLTHGGDYRAVLLAEDNAP